MICYCCVTKAKHLPSFLIDQPVKYKTNLKKTLALCDSQENTSSGYRNVVLPGKQNSEYPTI